MVEPRLSELQTQLENLTVALQEWRQVQAQTQPVEQRLAQLTEQCGEIVERWRQTDARQTELVAGLETRLGEWGAIESRIQRDSGERMRALERTFERECQSLRKLHEEPAKQLGEQAAALGETCVAAANLALRGFERAEARLAALEQDMQGRMTQLSRDLQGAIVQLQGPAAVRQPSFPGQAPAFPLEGVMRIHEDLRNAAAPAAPPALAEAAAPAVEPDAGASLTARMESLERAALESRTAPTPAGGAWWHSHPTVALLLMVGAVIAMAAAFVFWTERRVATRLDEAAARVVAIARQREAEAELAAKRLETTREDARRQVAEAHQAAVQAQVVGNVLAAPDLVRYSLSGIDAASRAFAQVLWSRSRGMVISASRLPPPPAGSVYQFWLLTTAAPVSGGVLTLDAAGRATLATDVLPRVPRPVTGALVTLEPVGGSSVPTATPILSRPR